MSLRGSGASFGFPQISELAMLLEVSSNVDVLRRVEGLAAELEAFAQGAGPEEGEATTQGAAGSWLARAAGLPAGAAPEAEGPLDVRSERSWQLVAREAGLEPGALVARVADYFGLDVADLEARTRSARRLVPEALIAAHGIVPLQEDPRSITVATANPASLSTELELEQLTGRKPVFRVAHPAAIAVALDELDGASPRRRPPEVALDPVPTAAPADAPPAPPARRTRSGPPTILVVDDEPSARLMVRSMLEKRGYRVIEAADGVAALDAAGAEDDVQLVVADLNMPRMDGLELVWELRDRPATRDLPVIVVTGEQDEVLETQLLEEGADDYVRKPIEPRLFMARVEATARRAEGADPVAVGTPGSG